MPKLKISTEIEYKGVPYKVELIDNVPYKDVEEAIVTLMENINLFNKPKNKPIDNSINEFKSSDFLPF